MAGLRLRMLPLLEVGAVAGLAADLPDGDVLEGADRDDGLAHDPLRPHLDGLGQDIVGAVPALAVLEGHRLLPPTPYSRMPIEDRRLRSLSALHPLIILYASHSEISTTSVKRKLSFMSCLTCMSEST